MDQNTSISATTFAEKMSDKPFAEATLTDFDDFWNETEAPCGGSIQRKDSAVTPGYYIKDGLECYDVQKASMGLNKFQGYLEGCIYKYLWRWEEKNGKQDLEKAKEYLVKLIETLD